MFDSPPPSYEDAILEVPSAPPSRKYLCKHCRKFHLDVPAAPCADFIPARVPPPSPILTPSDLRRREEEQEKEMCIVMIIIAIILLVFMTFTPFVLKS